MAVQTVPAMLLLSVDNSLRSAPVVMPNGIDTSFLLTFCCCKVQQRGLHVKGCRAPEHPPWGSIGNIAHGQGNSLQHQCTCKVTLTGCPYLHPPERKLPQATHSKQPKVWFDLQVSPLEQLEQLELLASSGFSDPHLNKHASNQVPQSFTAASASGHDSSQPEPALQVESSQEHVHDVQQQSRGSDKREGEGEGAGDIHAVGRLMVQLFQGKMLHHRATDHRQVGI